MSGFDKQKGQLQYIKNERLINKDNEELTVVTSGSGGVFKSGIPIGKINSLDILENNKIVVNFYKNFSQLKYVKILSHTKEKIQLDQNNKDTFKEGKEKISQINNQVEDIRLLQQQKIINNKVRIEIEKENTKLKEDLVNIKKKLAEKNKKIQDNKIESKNLEFLSLNLLHGHKCRKTMFRSKLYKIGTDEYRACVLSKGPIKSN